MKNISFTDKRLYVFGVGIGYMTDVRTGDILYWSDKFQEGNVSFAASDNVLNAGMGNGAQIVIPTDPNITVNVTAAEYSRFVKRVSAGGKLSYGAPVLDCQIVTAAESVLSLDVSRKKPVPGPGMKNTVCYVQEVGAPSRISVGGFAYPVDRETGAVSRFSAQPGKSYAVSYYAMRPNASMTTIGTNVRGKIVRFVLARPVYSDYVQRSKRGKLYGWLFEIVPMLQLNAEGASNSGGQTAYTTTGITGRAIAADRRTILAQNGKCNKAGNPIFYRVLVPCDKTDGVEGVIGILGGKIVAEAGESYQFNPLVVVNGKLAKDIAPADFEYYPSDPDVADVDERGYMTATGGGVANIAVVYTVPGTQKRLSDTVSVYVDEEPPEPPDPPEPPEPPDPPTPPVSGRAKFYYEWHDKEMLLVAIEPFGGAGTETDFDWDNEELTLSQPEPPETAYIEFYDYA